MQQQREHASRVFRHDETTEVIGIVNPQALITAIGIGGRMRGIRLPFDAINTHLVLAAVTGRNVTDIHRPVEDPTVIRVPVVANLNVPLAIERAADQFREAAVGGVIVEFILMVRRLLRRKGRRVGRCASLGIGCRYRLVHMIRHLDGIARSTHVGRYGGVEDRNVCRTAIHQRIVAVTAEAIVQTFAKHIIDGVAILIAARTIVGVVRVATIGITRVGTATVITTIREVGRHTGVVGRVTELQDGGGTRRTNDGETVVTHKLMLVVDADGADILGRLDGTALREAGEEHRRRIALRGTVRTVGDKGLDIVNLRLTTHKADGLQDKSCIIALVTHIYQQGVGLADFRQREDCLDRILRKTHTHRFVIVGLTS